MTNIENNDKITNISAEKNDDDNAINVKKRVIPLIHYKLNPILSTSILNYLSIGISLAIFGCDKKNFFKLQGHRPLRINYYFVSAIILYISGIFDWIDGKELLFLVDFILSFYFFSLYFLEENENKLKIIKNSEKTIEKSRDEDELYGTFYVTLFLLFLCIAVSYKNKGKFYIIDYSVLVLGFIFLFLHRYFDAGWMEDAYSYIFIADGILFWISGLLKMIDNVMNNHSIIFISPTD